jgi:mono/diheme cytochrome c family protein/glucose/arabinose dehydrogenase
MPFRRIRSVAILIATTILTGYGSQSSPVNRPWPPGVQKIGPESPPLSPEEALKSFYMPPGYRVELVAAEPLIQEPVAIDWDLSGRLWAVEMPGFMADITGSNEYEPIGRVVVLEDVNGDGRMDKRTVFADGLVLARSIKVLDRGVLVAEPPNVWLMRDTNGDLRMDTKELVTDRYGRRETDPQNNANGFDWSLDNRMYTAGQADIHLRLKNGLFELEKTLQRGEWGVTHDDAGRIYRNTNESPVHVDLVPTFYFARNPNLVRTRGSYERLANDNDDLLTVWPVRPNPGTNRAYQTGIDREDGTLARFTSVCAPLVYRGDRLPAELYGNMFVAEPAANLVGRIVLDDRGTKVEARKAYERGEFLASTDERFRPVYLSNAPDGTLYIADLYRGIIEHRISITVYLRDQILERKLEGPTGYGRIYRVMHEGTRRDTASTLAKASIDELLQALSHPNGWWRDTAHRLLVERAEKSSVPALKRLAESADDWRTRVRALWILDGLDAIEQTLAIRAMEDQSRYVRAAAIRIAERWSSEAVSPVYAAMTKRLDDPDWVVRQQLGASIGMLPAGTREPAAASLLARHGDDSVTVDAVLSGIRGMEMAILEKLLAERKSQEPIAEGLGASMTMLSATIVRSGQDSAIQKLFAAVGDENRSAGERSALLRGAEIALLGAPMPGAPGGTRSAPAGTAALPCPTCPGGRAGPGGAYAFSRPQAAGQRGRGRGTGPNLRLNQEPADLTKVASRNEDLGTRAAAVLNRVSWPGKAGDVAALPPLTADEQRRFDAGHEIYRNICQACHQPDGRGQDRLAPSLVGSELALASAEIPARILLNGKEGPVGLMPPIGAAINDEQIASVLTYIRREWGQDGTPVDPATVTSVRALTAGRARPWRDDELRALAGVGRGGGAQ